MEEIRGRELLLEHKTRDKAFVKRLSHAFSGVSTEVYRAKKKRLSDRSFASDDKTLM